MVAVGPLAVGMMGMLALGYGYGARALRVARAKSKPVPVPVPVPLCAVTRARMLTRVVKRMNRAIAMVNCFSCRKGLGIDSDVELMVRG